MYPTPHHIQLNGLKTAVISSLSFYLPFSLRYGIQPVSFPGQCLFDYVEIISNASPDMLASAVGHGLRSANFSWGFPILKHLLIRERLASAMLTCVRTSLLVLARTSVIAAAGIGIGVAQTTVFIYAGRLVRYGGTPR
jgi:hypothetical protein